MSLRTSVVTDSNPYLLNVANGTVDLRTGARKPHTREDLLRKITPIEYDPEAQCPTFGRFLSEIMDHDLEMVSYLQRLFGYGLLGVTTKQELAVFYGTGRNGKRPY